MSDRIPWLARAVLASICVGVAGVAFRSDMPGLGCFDLALAAYNGWLAYRGWRNA